MAGYCYEMKSSQLRAHLQPLVRAFIFGKLVLCAALKCSSNIQMRDRKDPCQTMEAQITERPPSVLGTGSVRRRSWNFSQGGIRQES